MTDHLPLAQLLGQHKFRIGIRKVLDDMLTTPASHAEASDLVAACVRHEGDYRRIGELLAAIYQAGFSRCVEEHQKLLESHGIRAVVTHAPPESRKSIF